MSKKSGKAAAILSIAGAATLVMAGCSSSSDTAASASPTVTPNTASASASPTNTGGGGGAECTSASLGAAIPEGAKVMKFDCSSTGDGQVAAVEYGPGTSVLFLETKGGKWEVISSDSICGAASAGLSPKVLAYCEKV
jgi:hypothetical protein